MKERVTTLERTTRDLAQNQASDHSVLREHETKFDFIDKASVIEPQQLAGLITVETLNDMIGIDVVALFQDPTSAPQ